MELLHIHIMQINICCFSCVTQLFIGNYNLQLLHIWVRNHHASENFTRRRYLSLSDRFTVFSF